MTYRISNSMIPTSPASLGPGHFSRQCYVDHCLEPVHEDIGIRLCDHHLMKAWAAFEIRRADDPSILPDASVPKQRDATSIEARGVVYFARVGDLIKIGWTSDIRTRTHSLRADAVFHTQPGTKQDERALHAMFNHLLVRGREWFRSDPELLAYIKGLH